MGWASEAWSQGKTFVHIIADLVDEDKLPGEFWIGTWKFGGFEKLAKIILAIISTNFYAYIFEFENYRWHVEKNFLYNYSTIIIHIATLASCFL